MRAWRRSSRLLRRVFLRFVVWRHVRGVTSCTWLLAFEHRSSVFCNKFGFKDCYFNMRHCRWLIRTVRYPGWATLSRNSSKRATVNNRFAAPSQSYCLGIPWHIGSFFNEIICEGSLFKHIISGVPWREAEPDERAKQPPRWAGDSPR